VNQLAPKKRWLDAALELAADETPLSAGLDVERRVCELAMATEDRVEGMSAFLEKRRPEFRGR
jgi:enoyl-CoA hydratase/carnithine racemase